MGQAMNGTVTLQSPEVGGDFTNEEVAMMVALNEQIPLLWTAHKESKHEVKRTKAELAQVRRDLSQYLHQMKALLSCPGREGLWSSFLREKRIPRASADRYVAAHEASLQNGKNNCITESFPVPDYVRVSRLVQRILPQLLKTLTTKEAAFLFISTVLDKLPAVDHYVSERYIEVYCPDEGLAQTHA